MHNEQTPVYELPAIGYTEPEIENVEFEPIDQREPGRFRSFMGRVATRVALVGAVLGSAFLGQGQDQDESAPVVEATPVLIAAQTCYKGVEKGVKVGDLCVTKETLRQPGKCSKTDEFIGEVAVGITIGRLRLPAKVAEGLGYAWGAKSIYGKGLCD